MRKCIAFFDGARGGNRHSATPRGEGRDFAKTENPRCFRETGKNADSRETRFPPAAKPHLAGRDGLARSADNSMIFQQARITDGRRVKAASSFFPIHHCMSDILCFSEDNGERDHNAGK